MLDARPSPPSPPAKFGFDSNAPDMAKLMLAGVF